MRQLHGTMRIAISIPFLLLAFSRVGYAQKQESGLTAAISQLPTCAVTCLIEAVSKSTCEITDALCICTNQELNANVEACVVKSCTLRQALTTKNVTLTTCHAPTRSRNTSLKVTNIALGVASAACVVARLVFKAAFSASDLGMDDYLILATLLFGIPSTIVQDLGTVSHGLGEDVWTLSFDTITLFAKWFYIMEVLYFFNVAMLKLSLLFFFQRIFPAKPVQKLLWGTIVFNILTGIAFVLTAIFQCTPISHYWEKWDGEHLTGKCINVNALGWANAIISILLDVWMLAVPLWQVSQLKMAWRKKLSVALMFCVGTFVTIISIIRLQSLISFGNSQNPTWDQADASNWSTIEINVGIMCACMPALRLILVRIFPRALDTSQYNTSNKYYAKYGTGQSIALKSGNQVTASGTRSGGRDEALSGKNANTITFTKTFEVRHGDDEEQLVQMDDLSLKGQRRKSTASSEASATGPITPVTPGAPRRPS